MVLLMAFLSACDILATDGARDAITGGTYETPSKIAAVVDRLLSGIKD